MEKQFGNKRYTLSGDNAIERHIGEIVNGVVQKLVSTIKPVSIFLSGSLAKGEIAAFRANNKIEIISDFEIGVVDWNWTKLRRVRKTERLLAREYDIDLTLLFFLPRRFKKGIPLNWATKNSPLSIEQYELIKTARFMYGRDFKKDCPVVDPADIPLWQGLRLLFNRMAELTGVLTSDKPDENKFFKACDKLLISCGDALLLSTGTYHHLYRQRKKLFEERVGHTESICSKLSCDECRAIIEAYERKIYCKEYGALSKNELLTDTLCISEKVFEDVIDCLMKIGFSSTEQFREQYLNHPDLWRYCTTNPRLVNMVCLLKNLGRTKPFSIMQFLKPISIQHSVYADVYTWLFGKYKTCWIKSGFVSFENEKIISQGKEVFERWTFFCL